MTCFFAGNGIGDFKGLLRRLDYLQGLGVTAIWLMPLQPSPGRDDGYDIVDYYGVDPKYGTLGDFVEFTLAAGESLQVETGCIVAFDESVDYDIQFVGGIKTALFGGEGLFLAAMTGPGRVIVQSMTINKLRRELAPGKPSSDEHNPLSALGGIFDSED